MLTKTTDYILHISTVTVNPVSPLLRRVAATRELGAAGKAYISQGVEDNLGEGAGESR